MRHRVAGRRLGRTKEHRLAMRRSIVASLFQHETISTTIKKAKEVKSFAEKLITLSRKGTLSARRRAKLDRLLYTGGRNCRSYVGRQRNGTADIFRTASYTAASCSGYAFDRHAQ